MIKEIATIFSRYYSDHHEKHKLLNQPYEYEAEALYENFEDRNIYDIKSLRQYVLIILKENTASDHVPAINDDMINELRFLFFK